MSMTHPNFVSPERISQICKWPPSDRRQLVKRLALTNEHGQPTNFREEIAFWRDLLRFLAERPSAYRELAREASELSSNGRWRSIHVKCFKNLRARCPEIQDHFESGPDRFVRDVCASGCKSGAIAEVADWLWSYWVAFGDAEAVNAAIESDLNLKTCFAGWRAPTDFSPGPSAAETPYDEELPSDCEDGDDDMASRFADLAAEISRAAQSPSIEALLEARLMVDELIERLKMREAAQLTVLSDVVARIRGRSAPNDADAAERRAAVLTRLVSLERLRPTKAATIIESLEQKIENADAAKQLFERAEAAHQTARFDQTKLHAYLEGIKAYGDAEHALTSELEAAAEEVEAGDQEEGRLPSDSVQLPEYISRGQSPDKISIPPTVEVSKVELRPQEPKQGAALPQAAGDANHEQRPSKEAVSTVINDSEAINLPAEGRSDTPADRPAEMPTIVEGVPIAGSAGPDTCGSAVDPVDFASQGPDLQGQASTLAERLLRGGHIGLFALACDVGRELGYRLPQVDVAVLMGTSGLSEPLRQLQFTDSVSKLLNYPESVSPCSWEHCLMFAALSLPAITDPTFISRNALSSLRLDPADFSAAIVLRKTIEDLGRTYSSIQEFITGSRLDPEEEFKNAHTAAKDEAAALKTRTVNYHAATMVAHRLGQELAQAVDYDIGNIDELIRSLESRFPPHQSEDELIRRLDRDIRASNADRKSIEARALTSLKHIVQNVQGKVRALVRTASILREQRKAGPVVREATHRKGRDLQSKFKAVAEEFRGLSDGWCSENGLASAGALIASQLLDAHASAFDAAKVENPFFDYLELDRYRVPAAKLDPRSPEERWAALHRFVNEPELDWLAAFDAAVERREHRSTQALLRVAQPLAGARELASERDDAIAHARTALQDEHRRVQDELLTVMNYAPPGETSLDPLYQSLASIDASLLPRDLHFDQSHLERPLLDFPDAFDELGQIRNRVHGVKSRALVNLKGRVEEQAARASAETIHHLNELISNGDLITVSEELSLIERGQDISIETPGSMVIQEFSKFLVTHGAITLADWFKNRTAHGGRADALIRKWQASKTSGPDLRKSLRDLFGELSFEPKAEAEPIGANTPGARVRHFRIRTEVISDREFCSVARFGSEAEGQYRVIITAKDPKPNEIVTAVPDGDTGATFILVPQWIGRDMRLQIASEARRLARTFCLIDDALIAFLCDRDRVIRDLFGCGIPFAAASPYVVTPGSIPVEAFFGRDAELTNIGSRDGSCIVYGGRQLGKSVLLDHIEQRGRINSRDRIAVRLDCQDVTERRELFELIEKKLPINPADGRQGILESIEQWIRGNPERSVLLMLDETNQFVRADAERDFDVLLEFRNLMERTNRRFKVVLSGQNNVLRLTQTPNTPLAHFGRPICIGPLKGADYKAARDLVAEPLAAVGYTFADEQLVSRILVETQFYPKLVQMFCRDLLNHVRTLQVVHSDLPPWKITLAHVEATLRNQKLTRDIYDTFKITLDLDKRYELIALIMALERSDQRKRGGIEVGMSERELRDKALYWWKDGFTSANAREEFEGLLEELGGLGILIRDRITQAYQLASPVIANLIGTEEIIYDRLLAFEGLPPIREIEPSKRRAEDNPLPKRRGLWLSPLVPAQVNRIVAARRRDATNDAFRAFLIYGSPDMRIDRIKASLEPMRYDEHYGINLIPLDELSSLGAFSQRLSNVAKPSFFVVSPRIAWDIAWVEAAVRSERGHVVVFTGDLARAWAHIVEDARGIRRLEKTRLETIAPLSEIELEDQLRRRKVTLSDEARAALMKETGGFLGPVGTWTAKHSQSKKDQGSVINYPRFESLPPAARHILRKLVEYVQPNDPVDVGALTDVCTGEDPKRVFDWLLFTGLATLSVESGEHLCLSNVFWMNEVQTVLKGT